MKSISGVVYPVCVQLYEKKYSEKIVAFISCSELPFTELPLQDSTKMHHIWNYALLQAHILFCIDQKYISDRAAFAITIPLHSLCTYKIRDVPRSEMVDFESSIMKMLRIHSVCIFVVAANVSRWLKDVCRKKFELLVFQTNYSFFLIWSGDNLH